MNIRQETRTFCKVSKLKYYRKWDEIKYTYSGMDMSYARVTKGEYNQVLIGFCQQDVAHGLKRKEARFKCKANSQSQLE